MISLISCDDVYITRPVRRGWQGLLEAGRLVVFTTSTTSIDSHRASGRSGKGWSGTVEPCGTDKIKRLCTNKIKTSCYRFHQNSKTIRAFWSLWLWVHNAKVSNAFLIFTAQHTTHLHRSASFCIILHSGRVGLVFLGSPNLGMQDLTNKTPTCCRTN